MLLQAPCQTTLVTVSSMHRALLLGLSVLYAAHLRHWTTHSAYLAMHSLCPYGGDTVFGRHMGNASKPHPIKLSAGCHLLLKSCVVTLL